MIGHYFASGIAKFRRSPFTTGANVLTLALGLACFIAAFGVASWWTSADSYHEGADRLVVVGQSNTIAGQGGDGAPRQAAPAHAISSWSMAKYLREDFPELEGVARVMGEPDMAVAAGSEKAILDIAIADPELLDLFAFDFIEVDGDPRAALGRPNSAILTQAAAAWLFGGDSALGQSVLINGEEEATVTAVIGPVRQPSFMGDAADSVLPFDMLRDWDTTPLGDQLNQLDSWIGINPYTVVRLPDSLSLNAFNARLPEFVDRRVPPGDKDAADIRMSAFPVSRLSTYSLDSALFANGVSGVTAVGVLLMLAALTLLVACVNYANLATAQAAGRVKEIGMRKTVGAGRLQVMAQSWLESTLLTVAALALALLIVAAAAPAVRASTGIDILFFLAHGAAPFAVLAGLTLAVALLAGAYPALVLSQVRPSAALGAARGRSSSKIIARILVSVQFASASFLLILLAVTQFQRAYLERTALATHQDPLIVLNDLMPLDVDYETLAARLSALPTVKNVTVVDHMPWGNSYNGMYFARSQDPAAASYPAFVKSVGHDYFETLGLDVLAGRAFDRERDTAPVSLFAFSNDPARALPAIISRDLSEALGFDTPEAAAGQVVYIPAQFMGGAARPIEIVGVTEPEVTRFEANVGDGQIYTFGPRALWGSQLPIVQIDGRDVQAGIDQVTAVWDEMAPTIPADIRFFDALFEQSFRSYARISQVFMLLAGAAFVIASLGLLGIAIYVAGRRRREIGVRKTLGASVLRILRLLLWDFSKPVLIANLIAWPAAYLAAQTYLGAFGERISLTPAPFLLSLAVTLGIAWLAVGGPSWRAARVKPAAVLKYE